MTSPGPDLSYNEGPASGPPLLLIHGVSSRWQPFGPLLPELMERYHVYAVDLRGHGRSSHVPGAYRLEDYSGDIARFIAERVGEPAAIYGHSLGALVGLHLAARQPGLVRALVLGDPPLYYWDTPIQQTFWHKAFLDLLDFILAHPDPASMERWLVENAPNMTPERREERIRSLETLDPDVVRAVIADALMQDVSLPALLAQVTCPALLLRGNPELGSALRPQDVSFALEHLPQLEVLEMQTVGHGILPTALLPRLTAFLDRAGQPGSP